MKKFIIIFIFYSCTQNEKNEMFVNQSDSVILNSKKIQDSANTSLKIADEITEKKVIQVVKQVNTLKSEVQNMKLIMKAKSVIVHDTIYITEKKNFWGKTKVKIDSSKTTTIIDSSLNEN